MTFSFFITLHIYKAWSGCFQITKKTKTKKTLKCEHDHLQTGN